MKDHTAWAGMHAGDYHQGADEMDLKRHSTRTGMRCSRLTGMHPRARQTLSSALSGYDGKSRDYLPSQVRCVQMVGLKIIGKIRKERDLSKSSLTQFDKIVTKKLLIVQRFR